ncbi:MAG: hypothetical protein CVT75_08180 [Alphaproteobacteria bacterium HGW-Alphaproteobacteria-14]|nr:MAG: hypothetical protein CVT75_08180 [Alphaproteobacteria bacterium HGW-Alphaproteobacteria-14]
MSKTSDLPHVSILVVAYNSQAIIGDCLASIPAGCSRFTYEVLLIDNGDGASADLVSAQFPEVMIVPSQGNVGFAAGNNLLAAQASGEHLLLLNPDVVLKPEAIDLLLDATKAYPAASAWGGVTLDRNDRPDLGNNVHIPSLREMASRTLGRSIAGRGRHDQRLGRGGRSGRALFSLLRGSRPVLPVSAAGTSLLADRCIERKS